MKVICCNCKKSMGEKEGTGISHGICEDCIKELYPDLWEKLQLKRKAETPQAHNISTRAAGFTPSFPAVHC